MRHYLSKTTAWNQKLQRIPGNTEPSPLTRGAREPSTSSELVVALKGNGNRGLRTSPYCSSKNRPRLIIISCRERSLSRKYRACTGIRVQNTHARVCRCSLLLQRHALVTCIRVLRVVSPNHLLYLSLPGLILPPDISLHHV